MGATGVGQICDVVMQIRGEAGERQVERHSLGLAQNLGGSRRDGGRDHSGGGMKPGPELSTPKPWFTRRRSSSWQTRRISSRS